MKPLYTYLRQGRIFFTLLLLLLLTNACDDDGPTAINSVLGLGVFGAIDHESEIANTRKVVIRGKGFGDEEGQLFIGETLIELLSWNNNRIVFTRQNEANRVNGLVRVVTAAGTEIRGPELLAEEPALTEAYHAYVDQYAADNGLQNNPEFPGWVDWMKGPNGFAQLYKYSNQRRLIEQKRILISYNYGNDLPLCRQRDWSDVSARGNRSQQQWDSIQESIHMLKLMQLLNASYPGYQFVVIKGLNKEEADLVVYTNAAEGGRSRALGPSRIDETQNDPNYQTIRTSLDLNLIHEIGHFLLGTNFHHCFQEDCTPDRVAAGQNMPPTEPQRAQECTMDKGPGGRWCNACAAALGIRQAALSANQWATLGRIKGEFNGRYRINQGDCGQ